MNPPSMTDILDIQGILHSSLARILLASLLFFLFFVSLLLLVIFIRRWRRRRFLKEEFLTSHERVFMDVARLRQQKFLERGDFRRYYFFLSEIFRRYLFERFGYPALDKTTAEIKEALKNQIAVAAPFIPVIEEILSATDDVKFAGQITTANATHGLTEKIILLVKAEAKG